MVCIHTYCIFPSILVGPFLAIIIHLGYHSSPLPYYQQQGTLLVLLILNTILRTSRIIFPASSTRWTSHDLFPTFQWLGEPSLSSQTKGHGSIAANKQRGKSFLSRDRKGAAGRHLPFRCIFKENLPVSLEKVSISFPSYPNSARMILSRAIINGHDV